MSAMDLAIQRWRAQAWRVVGDPNARLSLRRLAWRFLQQHGVV